jgi:hypothetical protein
MNEPCRCGGRNPYCSFCEGSGFVSPPTTFPARPHLHGAPNDPAKRAVRLTRSLFIGGKSVTLVVEDDGGSHLLCVACSKHVLRDRLLIHVRQSHVNRKKRCRVCGKMVKASTISRHFAAAHPPSGRTDREATMAKHRKRKPAKGKSRKKQIGGASLQRVKQGGSHDRGWRGRRI